MSKCWYCNNELTSGDNPKHFGICNKCYDKMFKNGDTIIRSFTNKIEELQNQLEDAEEHIDNLELQLREQYQLVDEKDEQLHDLPKKIVKEISKELKSLYKNYPIIYSKDKDIVKSCYDKDSVNKILDTILKKFGDDEK